MNRIIVVISFFIYSGFYAVLAVLIALGMMEASRIVTVPIRSLTTFLMLYVIFKMYSEHKINVNAKKIYFVFILFWSFYFIKVMLHANSGALLNRNWFEYVFFAFNFCILPFFTFSLLDFKKYQQTILNALIFSGFLMSIISLYLYKEILVMGLGRISDIRYENPDEETLNPLALSYAGSLTIALSLYQLFFKNKLYSVKYKSYLYLTIILSFIMFFLGASRGSVVAFALCLPIFLIYSKGKSRLNFILISVLSLPLILWGAIITGSSVFERTTETMDGGATGREQLWIDAWNEFINNPVFGGRIEIGFYPHNIILELLMATGIIGFIMFMLFLIPSFKRLYKLSKKDINYIWIFIILIQGFSQLLFSGSFYMGTLLFSSMGIVYSKFDSNKRVIN
jgi:oligosaccharide repeat unit polymerase